MHENQLSGAAAAMLPPVPSSGGPVITISVLQRQHPDLPSDITLKVQLNADPNKKDNPKPYTITCHELTHRFSHVLAKALSLWSSPEPSNTNQVTAIKYGLEEDDVEFIFDQGKGISNQWW